MEESLEVVDQMRDGIPQRTEHGGRTLKRTQQAHVNLLKLQCMEHPRTLISKGSVTRCRRSEDTLDE